MPFVCQAGELPVGFPDGVNEVFFFPRQNAQKEDFGRRAFPADERDQGFGIGGACSGGVLPVAEVVRSDHQDDDPRRYSVQFSLLDAVVGIVHVVEPEPHVGDGMGAEQPEPGILPILPEAVDRFSGPVVRNGVSDEDVFRLDVPVAFLNGFMARFPGVGMVPVLGLRFQGGRQGLRCFRYSRNQEEQQTEKEFFHGNESHQFVLRRKERSCLRLSIFFFPFRAVNGKKRYHAPWP